MKNLLIVLPIALLSTAVLADMNAQLEPAIQTAPAVIEFGADLAPVKTEGTDLPELVVSKIDQDNANLWEILDLDKDGFISKAEAASSKQLEDKWDSLDNNKDEKLDTVEFSQIFTKVN